MTPKFYSNRSLLLSSTLLALSMIPGLRGEAPYCYAIQGARIVPVSGPVLEKGTLLIRNGTVEAVGPEMPVSADFAVIAGQGLSVYPGMIDMAGSISLESPAAAAAPREARTRLELERNYRETILRPQREAAALIRAEMPDWKKLAALGITSLLAVPSGSGIQGCSSLVHTVLPEDPPQIGNLADGRAGLFVIQTPVALHVRFPDRNSSGLYPASLMGAIAFIRQSFLDAGQYRLEQEWSRKNPTAPGGPVYDAALEALSSILARKLPVVFSASSAVEIRRVLSLAREFGIAPTILGAHGADKVTEELKEQKIQVLFSLNYPVRPRDLAPDADESLRTLQERADAPRVPAALHRAGIFFAFASDGLKDPKEFLRNAARAVKAGLPAEAALRALTLNAATIAGAERRLGSIEKGKIASLLVTEGDLFDEKCKIRHVFINGRPVQPDTAEAPASERRRSSIE